MGLQRLRLSLDDECLLLIHYPHRIQIEAS